ncbi:hypothetical protein RZS08_19600, partial [Arthrospira platensis SPKY1]|nr:hypothetical protein [Arthrospira platensis SPKY1]
MYAKINQMGMEIPLEIVQLADGKTYTKAELQGMVIWQGVFDGEVSWGTNFQSMAAEKSDDETLYNVKQEAVDFPSALLDYEARGYSAEYIGTETIDGAETHKIKFTKKPLKVDGEMVDNVSYYYFDTEDGILIAVEQEVKSGPMKGAVSRSTMSDYDEVEGLFFPFSMGQGLKDGEMQMIQIDRIEL